jgi:hypothetical protein
MQPVPIAGVLAPGLVVPTASSAVPVPSFRSAVRRTNSSSSSISPTAASGTDAGAGAGAANSIIAAGRAEQQASMQQLQGEMDALKGDVSDIKKMLGTLLTKLT